MIKCGYREIMVSVFFMPKNAQKPIRKFVESVNIQNFCIGIYSYCKEMIVFEKGIDIMVNIQFMKEENAVKVKDSWSGKDKLLYVPDFDELVKNASCEEEIAAIRDVEERIKKGFFKGFPFQIVYMSYEKAFVYNRETGKQEWVMKWQMMQHPWSQSYYGVKESKERMIKEIERHYR